MSIHAYQEKLLPLRQQLLIHNQWLKQRLETIIPEIMKRENVDMWLVIAREYNEDPIIMTLLPQPEMSARRRTILVFHRQPDDTVERLTLHRYGYAGFYESVWNPDEEKQYECLNRIIVERNPQTIAINYSDTFAFGDGLSHNEYTQLANALDSKWIERFTSAERLCVGWLETRIEPEMQVYPGLVEMGHALIKQAFSTQVIHPGITTTDDVVWWMRQTMHNLGLEAWFQPSIEIQAKGQHYNDDNQRTLILPGDLLHCDVGFYYLGLATDQQQHAYILQPHETDAPETIKIALAEGNHLQDIHIEEMQVGKTGNQILKNTLERAKSEGINPMVYSHPIGFHGHAAGAVVGMWDQQGGVSGTGDYEIFDNTCYSIELNVTKNIPEWDNLEVRIALEEDAVLTNGEVRWLHGRQTQFHLIG